MPELYGYQSDAVSLMRRRQRTILSLPPGCGKTACALAAIGGSGIVVCPATAKGVWADECALWRPDLSPVILQGRGSFRYPRPGELVICNTETMGGWFPREASFGLIADECHTWRIESAQATQKMWALALTVRQAGGKNLWLSGTVMLHRPRDLECLLNISGLMADFGGTLLFDRLFRKQGRGWGKPMTEEIIPRLAPFLFRRDKMECLPWLPPKRARNIYCDLSAESGLDVDSLALLYRRGLSLMQAEKIVAAGQPASFHEVSRIRNAVATAKLPALLSIVQRYENEGTPVAVFSSLTAPLEVLARRPGWACITGKTTPSRRTRIVHQFQNGLLRGIGYSEAGGVSVSLTRAATVVVVSDPWSPFLAEQAVDRLWRNGQRASQVDVIRLLLDHPSERRQSILSAEKRVCAEGAGVA